MPARDNSYQIIGKPDEDGLANDYAIAERDNYEYLGRAGGAEAARGGLWNQSQAVDQRVGPTTDYSQADADMARALSSRSEQERYLGQLAQQQWGGITPQQAQMQASTDAAANAQRSLANSGRGFGAMTMAGQIGAQRATQAQMLGGQQLAMQQARDQASARDMTASMLGQMQGQDAATRAAMQERSMRDAQLTDEQRKRNDEMARFYLNERYRIGSAQLGANQAYEAQDAANRIGYSNLEAQSAERSAARQEAMENAAARGAGQGISFAATQIDEEKKKQATGQDSYSGGIIRQNPY